MTNNQNIALDKEIVSAQIIKLKKNKIIVKTENGEKITIKYPKSQRNDAKRTALFTKILKDIWHHHLWIPVNLKTNQMLQYDWLS